LLTFERGSTPEQLPGMTDADDGKRFLDLDALSDTSASMEESEVEGNVGEADAAKGVSHKSDSARDDTATDKTQKENQATEGTADAIEMQEDTAQATHGRVQHDGQGVNGAATLSGQEQDLQSTATTGRPQWSNAELYTALPPTEETNRKKKDVVKLIRKARVNASVAVKNTAPVADDADFISFGFDDDSVEFPIHAEHNNTLSKGLSSEVPTNSHAAALVQTSATSDAPRPTGPSISTLPLDAATGGVGADTLEIDSSTTAAEFNKSAASQLLELKPDRKRKRVDADDADVKPPVHKKGRGHAPTGQMLPHWAGGDPRKALPWLRKGTRSTDNVALR
jgi:hypothetical protein